MAEKIEVGVVIKGAGKAATDINAVGQASKNLGGNLEGNNFIVDQLTGSLDQMTNGAFSGFKKAATGLKTFITGLKTTKAAIIATGIGALVVAFGLLVTYWDDIKVLVNGVSSEQKNLLIYAEATRDAAQDQLDITNQSEASLRLAGNSERDILNLKLQQTNEIILATEAILIQQREQKTAQLEAAERNNDIAQGFIAMMALPLTMMLGTIDAISSGLAQLGVLDEATTLVKDSTDFMASFLFDPKKVEEEGEKVIIETENQLRKLKNTRDGFILQQQDTDAAAEQARKDAENKTKEDTETAAQDAIDKQKAIDDAKIAAQIRLEDELYALSLSARDREELELQQQFDKRIAIAGDDEGLIKLATERLIADLQAIEDRGDATQKEAGKKKVNNEKAVAAAVRTARLGVISASFDALNAMAKTEEQSKKLAIAQILVNQAIAMSQAIAGATTSATATGPGALVATPLFVAQAIGIVLSSFASIKGVMNQAGAATDGLDTDMPDLSSGGGGGGGGNRSISGTGNQIALTPDMAGSFLGDSIVPPVQAYIVQNDIADAGALQTELQNQASL